MSVLAARLLGGAVGVIVAGCGGNADESVVCTTEARASVVVRVVDAGGAALPGAAVNWRVNGGPSQAATCIGETTACSMFFVGQEVSGEFNITAEKAGWRAATATVKVQRDICHVITRELVLTLLPA